MSRIYLSVPHMGGLEQRLVAGVFEANWVSTVGPDLAEFEQAFSELIGLPSVALASGTAAIHLGLRALGVAAGDEVICPTLTFVASANPITYLGARPVFIDSEATSWHMDPDVLETALIAKQRAGKLPKAIVLVHLFGSSADVDAIADLARRFEVPILEDAAESLGASHRGRPVGSFGAVSAFSFNGNKIITTSGGGMLASPDAALVDKVRFWSTQARDPGIAYEHSELGYNYRLSNVLAAIGRAQLRVLAERVSQRRAVAARYREAFADLDGMEFMPEPEWCEPTHWLSCFTIDAKRLGCSRDFILERLASQDIEARPLWKPMHTQRIFRGAEVFGGSVAERLFETGLCLPSSSCLTEPQQQQVIDCLRAAVSEGRERHA